MQQYNKTIQKMINSDDITKENTKEHNPNWPTNPDQSTETIPEQG